MESGFWTQNAEQDPGSKCSQMTRYGILGQVMYVCGSDSLNLVTNWGLKSSSLINICECKIPQHMGFVCSYVEVVHYVFFCCCCLAVFFFPSGSTMYIVQVHCPFAGILTFLQRPFYAVAANAAHHMNMHILSLGWSIYCYYKGRNAPQKVNKYIFTIIPYVFRFSTNNMHLAY